MQDWKRSILGYVGRDVHKILSDEVAYCERGHKYGRCIFRTGRYIAVLADE
jgi:hypothetical protein